jgi:hypothetical protein
MRLIGMPAPDPSLHLRIAMPVSGSCAEPAPRRPGHVQLAPTRAKAKGEVEAYCPDLAVRRSRSGPQ